MGNKGIQKIKENKVEVLSLALCIGFYMLFCFGFGVQLCADSNSYINMTSAREPVYPLLLAFFRLVCGETYYLWGVIIFQNMCFLNFIISDFLSDAFTNFIFFLLMLIYI